MANPRLSSGDLNLPVGQTRRHDSIPLHSLFPSFVLCCPKVPDDACEIPGHMVGDLGKIDGGRWLVPPGPPNNAPASTNASRDMGSFPGTTLRLSGVCAILTGLPWWSCELWGPGTHANPLVYPHCQRTLLLFHNRRLAGRLAGSQAVGVEQHAVLCRCQVTMHRDRYFSRRVWLGRCNQVVRLPDLTPNLIVSSSHTNLICMSDKRSAF